MKRLPAVFIARHSPVFREWSNRIFLLGSLCFYLLVVSCSSSDQLPDGILSKQEMATVLTEFYLKEAKIQRLYVPQDSAQILFQYYRKKYEVAGGVPDSILNLSYEYYLSRPADLSEIYDQVIDSLSLKEHKVGLGK